MSCSARISWRFSLYLRRPRPTNPCAAPHGSCVAHAQWDGQRPLVNAHAFDALLASHEQIWTRPDAEPTGVSPASLDANRRTKRSPHLHFFMAWRHGNLAKSQSKSRQYTRIGHGWPLISQSILRHGTLWCGVGQLCCDRQGPVSGITCLTPTDGTCPRGCKQCVCANPDTPIATPTGSRSISELRVGDLVYSVDKNQIVPVPIAAVKMRPARSHVVPQILLDNGQVGRSAHRQQASR